VTVHISAPSGPGGGTDRTPPVVSNVTLSRTRWRRAVGTTIRFAVNEAGTARVAFARATAGRRVGGRCVRATRANRRRARCTRFAAAGSFTVAARQGANSVAFKGRLSQSRQLALGRYRVAIAVTDAAGNTSRATSGPTFRIVRR
jgi:hypothetical protein